MLLNKLHKTGLNQKSWFLIRQKKKKKVTHGRFTLFHCRFCVFVFVLFFYNWSTGKNIDLKARTVPQEDRYWEGGVIVTENDRGKNRKKKERKRWKEERVSVTDGQSFRRPHCDLYICVKSLCGSSDGTDPLNSSNPLLKQPPQINTHTCTVHIHIHTLIFHIK